MSRRKLMRKPELEPLGKLSRGWPAILSGLKSLLEFGTALAIAPAALAIERVE
jgi:hypothetical protein